MPRPQRPALPLLLVLAACAAACASGPATPPASTPAPAAAASPGSATSAQAAAAATAAGSVTAAARAASPAPERPRPYPVFESPGFQRAVEHGTRTESGRPGPNYWQQTADYRIRAELDPKTARVTGSERVVYRNGSLDTLAVLAVHLRQNAYAPTAMRDRFQPITDGMKLGRVVAQGQTLPAQESRRATGAGYAVEGTVAWVRLPHALLPGASAELAFDWSFTVPPVPSSRMGTDGEVFFVGYWYPQIAVYDDVSGWRADQFMTNAEFYMDFADYDVELTLPAGWLVSATGTLANPEAVLTPTVRERLAKARLTDSVTHVVAAAEREPGRSTTRGNSGELTWHFTASGVRDFAWGTSDHYLWDATRVILPGDDGRADTVAVNAFFRPKGPPYTDWARYAASSIRFLSAYLWPYPWPHIDVVDGTVGGMEYPMLVNITGARDSISLYSVTLHEIGHMWFPMQVGSDERRHSWQDEGVNTYVENQGVHAEFPATHPEEDSRDGYVRWAKERGGVDYVGGPPPLMRHGDLYPPLTRDFSTATYTKTAVVLRMLEGVLGKETTRRALREYGRRWQWKHPSAYDFFHTFDDVAGRDLSWFWRTWFYEPWTLDQAIASVTTSGDSTTIALEDRGLAPMPVPLAITRADGRVDRVTVPVDVWLAGTRHYALRVPASPAVTRVEIDPEGLFADVDRANQVWAGR